MVQHDYGTEIATQMARDLVVPLHREGGQAQYIDTPLPELDSANLFADTVSWLQAHLDQTVTVNDLAARAAMSPRTFARRFLASTGTTPYQWILRERIRLAQRLLETSDLPVDSVAAKSGLRTASNLRKHFSRALRTTPHAYRRTFQAAPALAGRPAPGRRGLGAQPLDHGPGHHADRPGHVPGHRSQHRQGLHGDRDQAGQHPRAVGHHQDQLSGYSRKPRSRAAVPSRCSATRAAARPGSPARIASTIAVCWRGGVVDVALQHRDRVEQVVQPHPGVRAGGGEQAGPGEFRDGQVEQGVQPPVVLRAWPR